MTFTDHTGRINKHVLLHLPSELLHPESSKANTSLDDTITSHDHQIDQIQQLFRAMAITAAHDTLQAAVLVSSPGFQVG